ncbi:septation protein SepH [Herbiconiux sp. P18]|uniref:septation protein SepH n=1 Tax=Herbiconiux liangxiaofengii TaxID=3342795 RepID=UPI0035BB4439
MQDLTVIGVENGALIVSSDGGERFRIVIDDVLQSRLRQSIASAQSGKKVSPREIQTHIRAGLSAIEVAELTGADVEYVERFEGPVLAERQFMVEQALRVPVQPTSPADPLGEEPLTTFGDALQERLDGLDARDVRWASWKDESGWIVKLTFTSREIEHDARWQFDPKRHVLTPLNNEATTLSRHGELTEGLIPRLRAVSATGESDRFDSGAFATIDPTSGTTETTDAGESSTPPAAPETPTTVVGASRLLRDPSRDASGRADNRPFDAFAVKRSDDSESGDHNQTADLLEALRRRRGEREAAAFEPQATEEHPVFGGPRPISTEPASIEPFGLESPDTPLEGLDAEFGGAAGSRDGHGSGSHGSGGHGSGSSAKTKRQRAAMPSWDEIVFGARSDDDPA